MRAISFSAHSSCSRVAAFLLKTNEVFVQEAAARFGVSRSTVEPEIRAAVEAAENWGTYVTVHAYTPRAIRKQWRPGSNVALTYSRDCCMGSPANTARLFRASNGTTKGMSHWLDSSIITRSN